MGTPIQATAHDYAAWLLAAVSLVLVLQLRLLPALLAGLLVFYLVNLLAARIVGRRLTLGTARLFAVSVIAIAVVASISLLIGGAVAFFRSETGDLAGLLQQMAEIIESSRGLLPELAQRWIPEADADMLQRGIVNWLRDHAADLRTMGGEAGHGLFRLALGMIIGGLVTLVEARPRQDFGPLARSLVERVTRLANAFRRVVFAQIRISAINALLTWLYLGVVLPLAGVQLPLAKTMVALTFIAGLIPVLGNLISNTVIFVISLSHSLAMALVSLLYLIVIHKLEYFLNAHIIGGQIRASPWEILTAMLVMEAAFGIPGLIAAPIFYAYVKDELLSRRLI
jgi:predicted PurR-regulated permease PerM